MSAAAPTTQMRPVLSRILQQRRGGGSRPKKLPEPISVWKIVRGDKVLWSIIVFCTSSSNQGVQVQVVAGKETGKQGTVVKVYRKEQKLLIASLNLVSEPPTYICTVKYIFRKRAEAIEKSHDYYCTVMYLLHMLRVIPRYCHGHTR